MNIAKKIGLLLMLTAAIVSCKKRDYSESGVLKPTNISASSNFSCGTLTPMFNGSPLTIPMDFSIGIPLEFSATFNETVTWKIVLRGKTSTAIKTISGTSSVLNALNASWTGTHDELYFFEKGEKVSADLIISGREGICTTDTIIIGNAKDSKNPTPTFMLVNPSSDFETNGSYPTQFSIFPVGGAYGPQFVLQADSLRAPEGVKFLRLYGKSTEPNGFFVGGVQSRKDAKAAGTFFPPEWTDPEKIYLNVYVRGMDNLPGNAKPFSTLNFECHEDDRGDDSNIGNCDYYAKRPPANTDHFCPSSEDSWVFKIPVRHTGWQLFSCKYSDLLPSEDFANGGFGNRKLEPQKVCRVQFGMVSSPPFNIVSIDMDYACFTYGAPYDPTK